MQFQFEMYVLFVSSGSGASGSSSSDDESGSSSSSSSSSSDDEAARRRKEKDSSTASAAAAAAAAASTTPTSVSGMESPWHIIVEPNQLVVAISIINLSISAIDIPAPCWPTRRRIWLTIDMQ